MRKSFLDRSGPGEKTHRRIRRTRFDRLRLRARRLNVEWLEDRRLLSIGVWSDENMASAEDANNSQALGADVNSDLTSPASKAVAPAYAPGEILVGFEDEVPAAYRAKGAAAALAAASKLVAADGLHNPRVLMHVPGATDRAARLATHWHLPAGADVLDTVQRLTALPGIAYAEPNYALSLDNTPTDPRFDELWGLHNTGQTGGTADADIDAPEAWDITQGSGSIVVGVIDTGVDYNHKDLDANIWTNPGEIAGNGIDDDGNGYIDDVHGWDFFNDDNDPMDDNGHGSHCSGTIGGVGNNGIGVAGVNWNVQIMGLKFLNSGGGGYTDDAVDAVNYATTMRQLYDSSGGTLGANIVLTSNSWGGGGYSATLEAAIAASGAEEMLFIAAAGNGNTDTDANPHYPSSYNLGNIISVAATDHDDAKASFSNWGLTTVDLAAPGVSILSTTPGDTYSTFNGTSMATPHVAGVAAMAWGIGGSLSCAKIRDAIFAGVDPNSAFDSGGSTPVATGGRLNAYNTLQQVGMVAIPASPATGQVVFTQPTNFIVNFSHPYDPETVELDGRDLAVNGITATSAVHTDLDTVTFHFASPPATEVPPATSIEGIWMMHMDAGAVTADAAALPPGVDPSLKELNATFRYDDVWMEVLSTDPTTTDPPTKVTLPMISLKVTFSEAYDPDSAEIGDLILNQGSVLSVNTATGDPLVVQYTLTGITQEDTLTVTMAAGALTDIFGNPMRAYSGSFDLDWDTFAYPTPLEAKAPLGSLIYDPTVSGFIGYSGDMDSFTIDVDPDQTITVVVDPDGSLAPSAALSGPGISVGPVSAGEGEDAVIQTAGPTEGGTYTITVGGADGSTGDYTLQVILNAAVEMEANDSTDGAQNIDALANSSFIPLAGTAERGAVLGGIEDNGCTLPDGFGYEARIFAPDDPDSGIEIVGGELQFRTDISTTGTPILAVAEDDDAEVLLRKNDLSGFQFNFYGQTYNQVIVGGNGQITFEWDRRYGGILNNSPINTDLSEYPTPRVATIAPFWDDLEIAGPEAAVYWEVQDVDGSQRLVIQFHKVRFWGSSEPGDITFQAILNESDGSMQFNYLDLDTGQPGAEGKSATVGIKDVSTEDFVPLHRLLVSYDEGPSRWVGTGVSTKIGVGIAPPPSPDYYAFSLAADERATLALKHTGGNADLELLDPSGNRLEWGTTGPSNVDEVIQYVAPSTPLTDTYYAVVTGDPRVQYNLVVTRGAYFDLEPNSGPEPWLEDPAQAIDLDGNASAVVLGHVRGAGGASDLDVLYFADYTHDTEETFSRAMANLGITPTTASSFEDFGTQLNAGGWDLAILMDQNGNNSSWVDPMVNWVDAGGRAIVADWTRNNTAATAFGAQYSGNNNQTPITQMGHPIWEGIADPLDLTNPGWGTWSMGLSTTTGTSIGTFPNGDGGLIVGNEGRTLLNGFLSDTPQNDAQGVLLAENEVRFVVQPEVDFYEIAVPVSAAGGQLVLRTWTPADGSGEFVNKLDPKVRVFDSSGNQVAADDDSADGRNAELSYPLPTTIPSEGVTYYIQVLASDAPLVDATTGEYVLTVETRSDEPDAGMTVNKTSVVTEETGVADTFTVRLNTQPKNNVDIVVSIPAGDDMEGLVSTAGNGEGGSTPAQGPATGITLTFDVSNWSAPQTVTVTGVDDFFDDGDATYSVGLLTSSGDTDYAGKEASISAINLDDDTVGVTVSKSSVVTHEATPPETPVTDSFTVVLDTKPEAGTVSIDLSTSDETEGLVSTAGNGEGGSTPAQGPATGITLTFDVGNWSTPQTVTVTGVDEGDPDGDIEYTITLSVGPTSSEEYTALAPIEIAATNFDDELIPLSWWTADATVRDVMGPNNGTLVGGAAFGPDRSEIPGTEFSAFSFDGMDDFVRAPTTNLPTGNSNRTLEAWVYANSFPTSGEAYFAGYGRFGSSAQTYHLGTVGDGLFFSQWGDAIMGPALDPGVWYHVAVTNVRDQVTLYLDGVEVGSKSMTINTPGGATFFMGRIEGSHGDSRKLDGLVDEVAVYNRALTADEIDSIYTSGKTKPTAGITVTPVEVLTAGLTTYEDQTEAPAAFTVSLNSPPSAGVDIMIRTSKPEEGLISTSVSGPWDDTLTVTFNSTDPQTVWVKGQEDTVPDFNVAYMIITDPASSSNADYHGMDADDVSVINIDDSTATGPTRHDSTDVPKNIPDLGTVTSELIIDVFHTIVDLDVQLNVVHRRDADLDVFLIAPDGTTTVELFTDVGGSDNNFTDTILDDEAATPITSGSAPFTGTFRPEGSLSDFDGLNVNGTWTLKVTDDELRDKGKLNSWSIMVTHESASGGTMTSTFTSTLAADSAGDAGDTDRRLLSATTLLDQSPSGSPLSGTGMSENARISLVYFEGQQASASPIPSEHAYDRAVDQVMDALARPADQNEEGPPPELELTLDGIDDMILEDLTAPLI